MTDAEVLRKAIKEFGAASIVLSLAESCNALVGLSLRFGHDRALPRSLFRDALASAMVAIEATIMLFDEEFDGEVEEKVSEEIDKVRRMIFEGNHRG